MLGQHEQFIRVLIDNSMNTVQVIRSALLAAGSALLYPTEEGRYLTSYPASLRLPSFLDPVTILSPEQVHSHMGS